MDNFETDRIVLKVSSRDLKYKDGEKIEVNKIVEGKSTYCGSFVNSSIDFLLENGHLTQEEVNILAGQMYVVKSQNYVRQATKDKTPASKVSRALKAKGLSDEQLEKVLSYIEKQ